MRGDRDHMKARTRNELLQRNVVCSTFFAREAPRLASACREMSRRFLAGGRLLACGRDASATDAAHVAVEFVHPVIVGKRALPALDMGPEFGARLPIILHSDDMVMGFSSPAGDELVERALAVAHGRGALTFALPGKIGDFSFPAPAPDPFVCQEVMEILYHVLWETVHVYFEHREQGHDVGASSFLYPFLGSQEQQLGTVVEAVQASLLQKVEEVNGMRAALAESEAGTIVTCAVAIAARLARGGALIAFGNGGSATDANDLVADCVAPPPGLRPLPALSLSADPAIITALANDIGSEAIFARQLLAYARPQDVAVGISTSGGSPNVLAALAAARKRGLLTVAILGYDGGTIMREGLADHMIVVRSTYVPRIQEVQASAYHVLRGLLNAL